MLGYTPIKLAGSAEQKKKYLGWLASEPILVSYATSEPSMGSDVAGMQCKATPDGAGGYVLNGTKQWITNGSLASLYVIFATVDTALRHKGIGAFIVERSQAGVKPGRHEDKLGQRASDTAPIVLEDVRVPPAQVLAAPGFGFKLAMETFNQTRPDIGAGATGLMRRCLDECVAYARERKAFGVPIAQHQLVQAMIAEMRIRIEASSLLVRKAAWSLDQGKRDPLTSACAEGLRRRCGDADGHRCGPGLRRLRVRHGLPCREAHARRQDPADLRRHGADAAHRHRAADRGAMSSDERRRGDEVPRRGPWRCCPGSCSGGAREAAAGTWPAPRTKS